MEHNTAQDSSLLSSNIANHPVVSNETTPIHSQYASVDHLFNPHHSTTHTGPSADPAARSNENVGEERKSGHKSLTKKRCLLYALAILFIIIAIGLAFGLGFGLVRHNRAAPSHSSGSNGPAESYNETFATSKPYYPSPKGGWVPTWEESYKKAAKLVSQMSLLEKVNVTTGTGWSMGPCVGNTGETTVGFPSLCMQDGPLGIRLVDYITPFPAGVTTAATFSKDLMFRRSEALGAEARAKGVHVLLGPCIGPLGRSPTGGRNWEGFGSDPYLQGIAGALSVRGIQSNGVIASVKHFIGNEQEHFRQVSEAKDQGFTNITQSLSTNMGERVLRELYAWPFAEAMRESPGSVMCSYNQVNNSYACQNSYLLNGLLKDELGFQGFVVSDWLAQRTGVASTLAGLDVTMPGDGAVWQDGKSFWGPELTKSILNGTVSEERINDMALRVVAAWYKMGQDKDYPSVSFSSWSRDTEGYKYFGAMAGPIVQQNLHLDAREMHHKVAREIATEAITLLKNINNALPLKDDNYPMSVSIFGSDAGPNPYGFNGCPNRNCNNGTLGMGWGSGTADYTYFITPLEAMQDRFLWDNKGRKPAVQYLLDDYDLGRAEELASTPNNKCFVFVSADAGEGFDSAEGVRGDRNDLYLWHNGDQLITTVASNCNDTVVIIHSVGPVLMENWIDHPNVTAVLLAHLPSAEAGSSLCNILWGDINPSGHLPYTIGKSIEDYGQAGNVIRTLNGTVPQEDLPEGLNIDYRWFDANKIEPRFEFGFGMSYTTFKLSNIRFIRAEANLTTEPPDAPPRVEVPQLKSNMPSIDEAVFPGSFISLPKYVYPYLSTKQYNSTTPYPYPKGYNTTARNPPPGAGGEGGDPSLWDTVFHVEVDVTNLSTVPGKAVPQLYITFPNITEYTPPRQLRGFEKVGVGSLETVTVGFDVRRKDISLWDDSTPTGEGRGWYIPTVNGSSVGKGFKIWVGLSSRGRGVEITT